MKCLSEILITVHRRSTDGLTVIDENSNNGLLLFSSITLKPPAKIAIINVGRGRTFDVNQQAVNTMLEQPNRKEALATICSIMSMPPPSSKDSWMIHKDVICGTSAELTIEEFIKAGR